jgi:hypothetical protein
MSSKVQHVRKVKASMQLTKKLDEDFTAKRSLRARIIEGHRLFEIY